MAITQADIQTRLQGLSYPCFTDAALAQIIAKAQTELSGYKPMVQFATFLTVTNVQDYYIFDTSDPVTQGCCANAFEIQDVLWDAGGTAFTLDIFSPGFHIFNNLVIFNGTEFHRPSDLTILQQKIDNFHRQFGQQGWEILGGEIGDTTAFLRLYATPKDGNDTVLVQMGVSFTIDQLASLSKGIGRYLMQWIEAIAAEAVARSAAGTAGITIGPIKESADKMKFWTEEAKRLRAIAVDTQGGAQGYVART